MYRSRTSPDRGWWVGHEFPSVEIPSGATGGAVDLTTVLTHDDITAEEVVSQDKSDWFVKRVIIEAYPTLYVSETDKYLESSVARLWSLAIGVMDSEEAASWVVNGSSPGDIIQSPNGFERWARLFRSYNRPVYRTGVLKIIRPDAPPYTYDHRLRVETAAASSAAQDDVRIFGEPYGPAHVQDDFEVSNAGIRDRQALYVAVGPNLGPNPYFWTGGNRLEVAVNLRILLQQRRGT